MKIYVIAPAFPCNPKDLDSALSYLKNKGHEVIVPEDLFGKDLICASSKANRIEQLKCALKSDAQIIWCLRGGYGSIELLYALKKMRKPRSKKIIWGYSDITALHSFFVDQWGWPVVHGPVLESMGQKNRISTSSLNLVNMVLNGQKNYFQSTQLVALNSLAKKETVITSKLAGGNLATLCTLIGTDYAWSFKNKILFLEEIGERAYQVDRMLNQLLLSGSLRGIKALVFADFVKCNEPDKKNLIPKIMNTWAERLKVPVFKGLKVGHGENQPPLPLNTKANLQTGKKPYLKAKYEGL